MYSCMNQITNVTIRLKVCTFIALWQQFQPDSSQGWWDIKAIDWAPIISSKCCPRLTTHEKKYSKPKCSVSSKIQGLQVLEWEWKYENPF